MTLDTDSPHRRGLLLAFAIYGGVTLLTFPGLVLRINSALPHDLGDPVLSAWILWWNAHHVPFTSAWWDGLLFWPMGGALALSDHRVGLGLISSPIQWLGGSPILAYNVTFLMTFPLSALAAHALAWRLTRSYWAAFIAGLIFGFNPYRTAHIEHLELLAAFWLPVALYALHAYVDTGRPAWLAGVAGALVMQGLSSGYYLMYAAPILAVWIVWFAHGHWKRALGIAVTCAIAAAVLSPVLLTYKDIQNHLGLTRGFPEISYLSADISSLVIGSPMLALWHAPDRIRRPEGALFPGAIAVALLVLGILQRERIAAPRHRIVIALRATLAALAVLFTLGALHAAFSPGTITIAGVTMSSAKPYIPVTNAVIALLLLAATSASLRDAFARRSIFAFYAIAAVGSWLFAFGPVPKLLGQQVLLNGPYGLLMMLPGYSDRLRVPARFSMIAVMTLSIAAAVAVAHIAAVASRRRYLALVGLLSAAILADSSISGLELPDAPPEQRLGVNPASVAAVFDLPVGDDARDIGAVYQSVFHRRPVVNGYSGYDPRHWQVVRLSLARGDDSVFDALAERGPLLVRVETAADTRGIASRLAQRAGTLRVPQPDPRHLAFLMERTPAPERRNGVPLPVRRFTVSDGGIFTANLGDGDPRTRWVARSRGREEIQVELDGPHAVAELQLMAGPYTIEYPRALSVATSLDGEMWTEVWRGRCGGVVLRALLENASNPTLRIPLEGMARFIRVRQTERDDMFAWSVAEIAVTGEARRQ